MALFCMMLKRLMAAALTGAQLDAATAACMYACSRPCATLLLHGMQELADACEAGDSEAFTDSLAEFDNMTRLDAWKTSLLLRVKKRMAAADDGDEPDLT